MTREALDSLDKETLIRLVLAQVEAIAALTRECEALRARVAELEVPGAPGFVVTGTKTIQVEVKE